jgi:hypothetical protein
MKLLHEKFQQFAADNKLRMSLDFETMGMCQVTVHGVDGGLIEGQGNNIQAAIFGVAEKLSGKVVKVGGVGVTVPVLVEGEK